MITCIHNSQQSEYRNPVGAVETDTSVELAIKACGKVSELSCSLSLWCGDAGQRQLDMNKATLEDGTCLFSVSSVISNAPELCWYYFILTDGKRSWYYGNNEQRLGGEGQLYDHEPPAFQVTVYKKACVPDWYKETIVYQIFPDRFARGEDWQRCQAAADKGEGWKGAKRVIQQDWSDVPYYTRNEKGEVTRWPFFGGTLEGIHSKLFYLKSMGVGAIYLNPIFEARSNHKYDTSDYNKIDPAFGTEEDFRRLAEDARRLGIRLILDGVFNHTGADSVYFNGLGNYPQSGACQGKASPYYGWYRFTEFPHEYECWWGVKDLPNVEENDPSYRSFIYEDENSVIRRWMKAGASGWRLDVADELPDDFIAGIRRAVKETDSEGLLMGEVWEDASNKVSYGQQRRYLLGDELDSTMNYPMRDLLMDYMLGSSTACDAVARLNSLAENYPSENFHGALNLIGSHDRARILTLLGDAPEGLSEAVKEYYRLPEDKLKLARRRLKIISMLQYVLPGVPCLYYGDEAGVQGYEDPYNRAAYPWGREDEELLSHYRMLALLRSQYPVLCHGDFSFSYSGDHVFICRRYDRKRGESIFIVVNRHIFGDTSVELELPEGIEYGLNLLDSEELCGEDGRLMLEMPPLSARLIYCTKDKPKPVKRSRAAGILCHVSSLPGGGLDDSAEKFIDFLAAGGQRLWQILPLNPAEEMNGSPYSSPAVFAGNEKLVADEILSWDDRIGGCKEDEEAYRQFCIDESYWLEDYALYTVIKEHYGGIPWQQWPEKEKNRATLDLWRQEKSLLIEDIKRKQFIFHRRWAEVKAYANSRGISIIGDIPIYVGVDSADTWAHRQEFLLDEAGYPLVGAGVPPDYFSEQGQNWGNPLYDWQAMKKNGYDWWLRRISKAMKEYDYIRLDHFRSFSAFFAIPAGKTPKEGWWIPGAGKEFFSFLEERLGPLPVIAEDLGFLDAQVHNLMKHTGYAGMLVYQFSVEEMETLTEADAMDRVFYSGTHDNQTLKSWCRDSGSDKSPQKIMEELYESDAPWVILQLQDILGLDDTCRMNVPGQAEGNWKWKVGCDELTPEVADGLRSMVGNTNR